MFVLCALLLPAREGQAQSFGLVGGATFAKINVSGDEGLNASFGEKFEPVGGMFVGVPVTEHISIEPEALLSVKGSLLDRGPVHERIRLTYLEMPVLVRFAPGADSPVRWLRITAGPYVAYLLDARTRSRGASRWIDLRDTVRTFDAGWVTGLGVHVANVDLDARYGGSFTDIGSPQDLSLVLPPPGAPRLTYRNRGFTFVARFGF